MENLRVPGFVWTAILVAATAFLQSLGTGLEGLQDVWWAPVGVVLVAAALKAIRERQQPMQAARSLDGSRGRGFWRRFLLG